MACNGVESFYICDAQVHGPDRPAYTAGGVTVRGMNREELQAEMATAHVDRAIVVPLGADQVAKAIETFLDDGNGQFGLAAVVSAVEVVQGRAMTTDLATWSATKGVVGVRMSFYAPEARQLLGDSRLEALWSDIGDVGLPVFMNIAGEIKEAERLAHRHPEIRFTIDHLGLIPFHVYSDYELRSAIGALKTLATYDNVAVKATQLPGKVADGDHDHVLKDAIRQVIDIFGPKRVFWGSDLTLLHCKYADVVSLFSNALDDEYTARQVFGLGVADWINWPHSEGR